ncbi:MAG: hypothetical protein V3W14_04070 [Candidatus Neomarinimicrobiota bacterium]
MTRDLRSCIQDLHEGGRQRLAHPELLHIEQHDDAQWAHRRLQDIRRRLREFAEWPSEGSRGCLPAPVELAPFIHLQ